LVPFAQVEELSIPPLQGEKQEESSAQGEETVTLNFEDADIRAVIHSFATTLGFPYSPDPRVQGKVTIRTAEPIPKRDLWPLFHHILRSSGLAAVKVGDVYQIIPISEAKTKLLFSGPERQEVETADGFVIELVKVKHIPVADMVNAIQPFVSPGGDIITYAPRNLLIITDLASNVQRLKDVIAAFDISLAQESLTRVYRIKYANVEKVGEEIKQVLTASGGNGVSVVAFPRLNSMAVITSNPEVFPQVQRWIEELDVPVAVNAAQETHTRLYRLKHANVEKVGEEIKQVLAASGVTSEDAKENSVSVVPLPRLNSVAVITSHPGIFPQVQKWIEELDVPEAAHFKLVGVFMVPGQEEALLLDSSQDGKREILRIKVGEEIGGYKLVRVDRTRAVLIGPGGDEVSLPLTVITGEEAAKAPRMPVAPPSSPPVSQTQGASPPE
jgi:general secretion pathway protein D